MKTVTISLLFLCTICLVLAACGGGGKPANESGKPGAKKEELLRKPVPADYAAKQSPTPLTDAAFIAKGKALYEDGTKGNCFMCHGSSGKGDGTYVENKPDPAIADLTAASFQDSVTDQYILWRITDVQGSKYYPGSAMLGFPGGSEEERWAVVAYVRSLKK